jgi:hypothetical protein
MKTVWEFEQFWTIAALIIANEVRQVAEETKALTTTYEKCKIMLMPIASDETAVGLV